MRRIARTVGVIVFLHCGVVWAQPATFTATRTATKTVTPTPIATVSPTQVPPAVCGNGILEGTEQCDPPGPLCPSGSGQFCNPLCVCATATPTQVPPAVCGNGILEGTEQCDPPGPLCPSGSGQFCNPLCVCATATPTQVPPAVCGNGILEGTEQCDPPGPLCPSGSGQFCNPQCACATATPTRVPPTSTPSVTPTRVPPTATPTRTPTRTATRTPDLRPAIAIPDVVAIEGDAGPLTRSVVVSLSKASTQTVTVAFATADGTARARVDYIATSGTLTFPAGALTRTILFSIIGDFVSEPSETFFMNLSNPTNATIADAQGVITIPANDLLGTTALTPHDSTIQVGARTSLTLTWTHPQHWRNLNTIDLRLADAAGVALWLRFDEAGNTFSVCEAADICGPGFAPGSAGELQTAFATVYLKDSAVRGSGPTGPSVDLVVTLSLESAAAGRVLHVEAAATDDAGQTQDFEETGTLTVQNTGDDDGCSVTTGRPSGGLGSASMLLLPLALAWRRRRVRA